MAKTISFKDASLASLRGHVDLKQLQRPQPVAVESPQSNPLIGIVEALRSSNAEAMGSVAQALKHVAVAVQNMEPPAIPESSAQPERRPVAYEFTVTKRDYRGNIEKFTATPILDRNN